MKNIQCPAEYTENSDEKSIFIAGGISGCRNWQNELIQNLKEENITILNPRREEFNLLDKKIEEEQINWEFRHLSKANAVSFWFSKETLCPITLFELGKMSKSEKEIFIGVDPEYKRKIDLEIQMKLEKPNLKIVYSIQELSKLIKEWAK